MIQTDKYLDIPSFFDGVNELELQQYAVTPEVNAGDGADDDVDLLDGVDEAPVIGEGSLNEMSALLLEGKQHLKLLNLKP